MVTAVLKTITLRPQLNRFIANYNLYQRNEVTAAFTVKRIFSDDGDEALAVIHAKEDSTLDSVHDEIYRQVSYVRHEGKDQSTESMDMLLRYINDPNYPSSRICLEDELVIRESS